MLELRLELNLFHSNNFAGKQSGLIRLYGELKVKLIYNIINYFLLKTFKLQKQIN